MARNVLQTKVAALTEACSFSRGSFHTVTSPCEDTVLEFSGCKNLGGCLLRKKKKPLRDEGNMFGEEWLNCLAVTSMTLVTDSG